MPGLASLQMQRIIAAKLKDICGQTDTALLRDEQYGDEQLFQFGRTDVLYFEDRLIWPVAVSSDK